MKLIILAITLLLMGCEEMKLKQATNPKEVCMYGVRYYLRYGYTTVLWDTNSKVIRCEEEE